MSYSDLNSLKMFSAGKQSPTSQSVMVENVLQILNTVNVVLYLSFLKELPQLKFLFLFFRQALVDLFVEKGLHFPVMEGEHDEFGLFAVVVSLLHFLFDLADEGIF